MLRLLCSQDIPVVGYLNDDLLMEQSMQVLAQFSLNCPNLLEVWLGPEPLKVSDTSDSVLPDSGLPCNSIYTVPL